MSRRRYEVTSLDSDIREFIDGPAFSGCDDTLDAGLRFIGTTYKCDYCGARYSTEREKCPSCGAHPR
jgi:rubrerythrin